MEKEIKELITNQAVMMNEVKHIRVTLDEHNAQTAEIAEKAEQNKLNHLELKAQISGGITTIKWIFGIAAGIFTLIQIASFAMKYNQSNNGKEIIQEYDSRKAPAHLPRVD